MAKGIEIAVGVDSKAAKLGLQAGLIEPLEDAQAALKEIGDSNGPDELERNLRAAQDATERLRKETKETADAIERDYKEAYRKQKQAAHDSMKESGSATKAFKEEAIQNFSETASSFSGDMTQVAQGIQGTLGGLANTMAGPVGLAMGGIAAIGGAALAGVIANAEQTKQVVSDTFDQMAAEGIESWKTAESFNARLTSAYKDHLGDIDKIADLIGISSDTVASAWAGDKDALTIVNAAYSELTSTLQDIPGASVEATNATRAGWDAIIGKLYATTNGYDEAQQKAERLWDQLLSQSDKGTHQMRDFNREMQNIPATTKTTIVAEIDTGAVDAFLRQPHRMAVDLVGRSGKRIAW